MCNEVNEIQHKKNSEKSEIFPDSPLFFFYLIVPLSYYLNLTVLLFYYFKKISYASASSQKISPPYGKPSSASAFRFWTVTFFAPRMYAP